MATISTSRNLAGGNLACSPADASSLMINVTGREAVANAPALQTENRPDASLVPRVRRGTGNDLIFCAMLATIGAFFLPLGALVLLPIAKLLLEAVSLFLLARVVITRSEPSGPWIACGVLVAIWNVLQIMIMLLPFALAAG